MIESVRNVWDKLRKCRVVTVCNYAMLHYSNCKVCTILTIAYTIQLSIIIMLLAS